MAQRNIHLGPRSALLHIEGPGFICNIQVGLADERGRPVSRIAVSADGDRYSGDPQWWIDGRRGQIGRGRAVRVVCTGLPKRAAERAKYGDQRACARCGLDIEFHGARQGWRDRGNNRTCVPFYRDGELVTPRGRHCVALPKRKRGAV